VERSSPKHSPKLIAICARITLWLRRLTRLCSYRVSVGSRKTIREESGYDIMYFYFSFFMYNWECTVPSLNIIHKKSRRET
jgi:hypothetical protein